MANFFSNKGLDTNLQDIANVNIAGSTGQFLKSDGTNIVFDSVEATSLAAGSSVGTLTLDNASITDSSGSISFGDENLSTTGTLGCGVLTAASGSAVGNLTLSNGSITDSSGSISFADENLSTSGTLGCGVLTAASGSAVGNLTLSNGSITDSSGAISFDDENLTTTGTLGCGVLTAASGSAVGNLTLSNGSITDSSGAISFGNENLTTTGTLSSGTLTTSALFIVGVQTETIDSSDQTDANSTATAITQSKSNILLKSNSTDNSLSPTDTYYYSLANASTEGTTLNLFFDKSPKDIAGARIDFGSNELVSASGATNRYLTFTVTGQSASLIFIDGKWRIINSGATVS